VSAFALAVAERPVLRSFFDALRRLDLHSLLFIGLLYYTFVGTHPLSDTSVADRADGSPLDRFVVFGLFGIALVELWRRRAMTLLIARGAWLLLALNGFCLLSIFWSDYPDLTLRRGLLLVLLTTIALGVAVGVTDLRRFHTTLFASFAVIIVFNIVMIGAAPGSAISPIGVKGIYVQKNVAGMVAMLAVAIAATWTIGAQRRREIVLGLGATVVMFGFLVVTRSKTSMGLALLAVAIAAVIALAEKFGPRLALVALSGLLALAAIGIGLFAAIDFDFNQAFDILLGDSSFTGRDEIWGFAWRNILDRPWLGHGYGAFWDVGLINDPIAKLDKGTWLGDVEVGVINEAHNGYLELCLHVGIPATVVAALIVIVIAFFAAHRAIAGHAPRADRAAMGAMAAILFLYLVHNYTEATFFMRGSPLSNLATLALFIATGADTLFAQARFPKSAARLRILHDR
jgi:O-antigen ligase